MGKVGVEEREGRGGGGGAQPVSVVPLEGREQKELHWVPARASWVGCNILVKRDPATAHGRAPSKSTKASFSTIAVVQLLSHVRLFATPWTAPRQASLSFTNSRSLLKLTSIESVVPSIHLILYCPLPLLPSIFPGTRVSSNESALQYHGDTQRIQGQL